MELFIAISLLFIGYVVGTIIEKAHYSSIILREKTYESLKVTNSKRFELPTENVLESRMVYGSAVISIDYFKKFLAGLINILGGRVASYESLLDRARREAVLRMKKMAKNADIIVNVRYETSTVAGNANSKESTGCVEVLAYGTAIKYK